MKTLKPNQKRWFISSAVIMCLGMTSFTAKPQLEGSTDMSSLKEILTFQKLTDYLEGKESKNLALQVDDGNAVAVKIESTDNPDEVLAYVPQLAEGKVCNDCTPRSYVLPVQFASNFSEIKKALNAAMEQDSSSEDDDRTTSSRSRSDRDEDEKEEDDQDENPLLAKILDKCEDKDDDDDRLECFKRDFMRVLSSNKDRKNKKLSLEEAHDFFQEHIEKGLVQKIFQARRASSDERRSYMSSSSFDEYGSEVDHRTAMQDALEMIEDLLVETPSRFTRIRDSLLTAQKKIMQMESNEVGRLKQMADSFKDNPTLGLMYNQQAMARQQEMVGLWNNFQGVNRSGFSTAYQDGNIDEVQYRNYYADQMRLNTDVTSIMTSPLGSNFQMDLNYLTGMEQRLLEQGRNQLGLTPVTSGNFTRTTNFSTVPNSNLVAPVGTPINQFNQQGLQAIPAGRVGNNIRGY